MPAPNTKCKFCEKMFHRYEYRKRLSKTKNFFCSNSCSSKYRVKLGIFAGANNPAWKGGPVTLTCAICNIVFDRERSAYIEDQNHYYCSQECQHKGLSKFYSGQNSPHVGEWYTESCYSCNRPVTRPKWAFRGMVFCNMKCFGIWKSENFSGSGNPAWKGGYNNYYGPNWKRQAKQARKRDNYTCQACGITQDENRRKLDVHHITRFHDFDGDWKKANHLDNLVTYCHSCHMSVENDNEG